MTECGTQRWKALIRLRLAKRAFWERATGSQTICTTSRTPVARGPKGATDEIKSATSDGFTPTDIGGEEFQTLKNLNVIR